ncbi:MAG: ASKHA domain-containing protein [Chloroflexota bacterium]|nr:ASKHA domain-containing protein [Chloroflexota bacterium]
MSDYAIDFEPVGRIGQCTGDTSLLTCSHHLGVGINSICGGQGTCQSCKIQVVSGTVSKPDRSQQDVFSSTELKDGWRLACQTYPASDCTVYVPPDSMTTSQRTQVEGVEVTFSSEPPVRGYDIELPVPSLSGPVADGDSLLETLNSRYQIGCRRIDIDVLRSLSLLLRSEKWKCQVSVRDDEVVAIGQQSSLQLGLAVDVGTTKIAGYLVDLRNAKTLASRGIMNPQISYGEDVISRINNVTKSPDMGMKLQRAVIGALNSLAIELCAETNTSVEQIVEAVVVGNTAMHHILAGLPVRQLAQSPFIPAANMALDIKARDLGLSLAPGSSVHLLPNVAGFVGADHVAMLLATKAWQARELTVALDIGTNTEISLISNGEITSVSCASGPAFEGYHIEHGMRAASGAIERVRIADHGIQYQTVDDMPPVGICGSGIIDAIAQLYLAGAIDKGGRMKDRRIGIRTRKKQREFVLAGKEGGSEQSIVVTQGDVRELQLAKAAIRSGIQVLLDAYNFSEEDITRVIIAGAFGTYIDISSAIAIGMLPALPLERFRQVGNAAGTGARLALISLSERSQAASIASRLQYIELASSPHFTRTFVQSGYLGRYRIRNGERLEID